jgi:type IV fimbrial biogenesis protein FimT
MGYRKGQGLTLVELVVTLAVLTILIGLAGPVFRDLLIRNQVSTAANLFVASLHLARSEAARSGSYAAICPGTNAGCDGTSYDSGWIVFIDHDHDGFRESMEPVVRVFGSLDPRLSVAGNMTVNAVITYAPSGYTEFPSGAFQAGTVTVCRPPHARRIVISRAGRPRVEVARC